MFEERILTAIKTGDIQRELSVKSGKEELHSHLQVSACTGNTLKSSATHCKFLKKITVHFYFFWQKNKLAEMDISS